MSEVRNRCLAAEARPGAGGQQAIGYGRMSRDYGEGLWRGSSAASSCSGHWEAERR